MSTLLSQFAYLIAKDLRIEARSRQTLGLVVVLGLLIVVVLGLGLGPEMLKAGAPAVASLWVAYLFGGVLCFEKTMAVERQDGALASLLLAPVDRAVIYLAKLVANLTLMFALAAVVTPAAIVLFGFDLSAAPLKFIGVMALSMLGFAAVGTLFACATSSSRLQGGMLAMVVFPISLPLVITSTQILLRIFDPMAQSNESSGILILVAFDVLYLITSWIVFETVIEP